MDECKIIGIPPVGSTCWAKWIGGESKVTFKGGFDSKVWFSTWDNKEVVIATHNVEFYTKRTEKEVQTQEMRGIVADFYLFPKQEGYTVELCREEFSELVDHLYKQGCRIKEG